MNKVTFTPFEDIVFLCEIFQSLDIKFSILNDKLEELIPKAKCRDFLGDCSWSRLTGNKVKLYGIEYSFNDKPYDTETLRLTLKFPNETTRETFLKNIDFVHTKERKAGTSLTQVFETQEKDTLMIEADKIWMTDQWRISLYTYYLKCLSYPDPNNPMGNESRYASKLIKKKEDGFLSVVATAYPLFRELDKIYWDEDGEDEGEDTVDIYKVHNESGFYSILCGEMSYPKGYFPF